MKKFLSTCLIFLGLFAVTNCYGDSYQNTGFYVGALGGPAWAPMKDYHDEYYDIKYQSNTGYRVGGIFGYKFWPIASSSAITVYPRLEGEIAYQKNTYTYKEMTDGIESEKGKDNYDVLIGMANAYLDLDIGSRFTPYVGGGVGFSYHTMDTGFKYQGIVGVNYALCEKLDLSVDYRYLGGNHRTSHSVCFGIKKFF